MDAVRHDHNLRMRRLSFSSGQGSSLPVKLTTALLWAGAAAIVVFWGLRFAGSADAHSPVVPAAQAVQANAQALAKALGAVALPAAGPVVAPVASRYALMGVVAGRESGAGAVVIAVSGQPARAVRVGDAVEDGVILQSLSTREARLGPVSGPATTVLELPKPAIAAFN